MFAQCPDCLKAYPVTKERLRKNAFLFCRDCKKNFNALEMLSENSTGLIAEAKTKVIRKTDGKVKSGAKNKTKNQRQLSNPNTAISVKKESAHETASNTGQPPVASERLPWEADKTPARINWFVGFVAGLLLLFGQIIYFEGYVFGQNATYRPQMEKICRWLGCHLPYYKSLNDFEVALGTLTPKADNSFVFKAIVINQAAFEQRLPNIKLSLLDFNEQLFAQRIFSPNEYLSSHQRASYAVAPEETIEASLNIAAPKTRIGGYNLDLTY
jgi:hypothetical protein